MNHTSASPVGASERLQMAQTRRRLGAHLRDVGTLAAPARLMATGVHAVKHAATDGLTGALHQMGRAAVSTGRRPGVMAAVAGGVASLALAFITGRRRRRQGAVPRGVPGQVLAAVLRPGSPWLVMALTIGTALLRRR